LLGISAKLYPRILGLVITPDPKVIFIIIIIIIIIINLHDPVGLDLGLTLIPDSIALDVNLATSSSHKSMIIKKKKNQ
jgi:hypothetical protein